MLLDQPFKTWEKSLALHFLPSAGRELLEALLTEWNYRLLDAPGAGDLLLIEHGLAPPPVHGTLLWLTPEEVAAPDHLSLPVAIEDLWRNLEGRFNAPPRAHIRIALDLPVSIHWHYQTSETQLISLSDMGCRFLYRRELAPGEGLVLHLPGEGMTLAGKVIYGMERGDMGDDTREIGVLFDRPAVDLRDRLRELIVATYLTRVRARMAERTFWQGLDLFRLAPATSERLIRFNPPAVR